MVPAFMFDPRLSLCDSTTSHIIVYVTVLPHICVYIHICDCASSQYLLVTNLIQLLTSSHIFVANLIQLPTTCVRRSGPNHVDSLFLSIEAAVIHLSANEKN